MEFVLVEGVEDAKVDSGSNKVTVTGKFDAAKLREKLEEKTKKKVELISPAPKKEAKDGGADKKTDKKPDEKKADDKKPDEKKADDKKKEEKKEVPFVTCAFPIPSIPCAVYNYDESRSLSDALSACYPCGVPV